MAVQYVHVLICSECYAGWLKMWGNMGRYRTTNAKQGRIRCRRFLTFKKRKCCAERHVVDGERYWVFFFNCV